MTTALPSGRKQDAPRFCGRGPASHSQPSRVRASASPLLFEGEGQGEGDRIQPLAGRDDPKLGGFFQLACGKRPAEELYDLAKDPWQLTNVAEKPDYAESKQTLRAALDRLMKDTADPMLGAEDDPSGHFPYYGGPPPGR